MWKHVVPVSMVRVGVEVGVYIASFVPRVRTLLLGVLPLANSAIKVPILLRAPPLATHALLEPFPYMVLLAAMSVLVTLILTLVINAPNTAHLIPAIGLRTINSMVARHVVQAL